MIIIIINTYDNTINDIGYDNETTRYMAANKPSTVRNGSMHRF